jgi:hypothetical protein
VVLLPFDQNLNKGELRLIIRAIPGRTDAVEVKAKSGFREYESVEWTQEGSSTKELAWRHVYRIAFLDMQATGGTVSSVRLSVQYKSKLADTRRRDSDRATTGWSDPR